MLKVRGSASYKTSFPNLQAYTNTESAEIDETKNDSNLEKLKPEKSFNSNVGAEIALFDNSVTLGCDYFFSSYTDRLVRFYQTKKDDYIYRNMDSSYLQGTETTLRWDVWDILDIADFSFGFTHTYIYARNLTKMKLSTINKGRYFEKLPEHKFTVDFRLFFTKTKTSFFVFGYYEYGQIQYATKYRPEARDEYTFTTDCWTAQKLNDPLMIDIKISQKVFTGYGDYEAYLMCKNVMDDYLPDPFHPGPGRTFYLGLKASY
jgi:outer membrane receptor for ferrienterochelin and colicin